MCVKHSTVPDMVPQCDVAFYGVHYKITKCLLVLYGCREHQVVSNLTCMFNYYNKNILAYNAHLTHACTLNTTEEMDSSLVLLSLTTLDK